MKKYTITFNKNTGNKTLPEIAGSIISLIIILILWLFAPQITSAQNIQNYDEVLKDLNSVKSQSSLASEVVHLKSLMFELQPSLYLHSQTEKQDNKTLPVCLNTDNESIAKLYEANPLFSEVELITIYLKSQKDLDFILEVSRLLSFKKLRYIQFLCGFECVADLIRPHYKSDSGSGIVVFYRISIPN